jgi:hypothetical protein
VAGVLLLAGFVLVERRLRPPLIDLTMFRRRNFGGASITPMTPAWSYSRSRTFAVR